MFWQHRENKGLSPKKNSDGRESLSDQRPDPKSTPEAVPAEGPLAAYQQEIETGEGGEFDPLLECLVFLTHYYDLPRSREALCVGLPMKDHKLTPHLFIRASERAGFHAQVQKRSIASLPDSVLPVVLACKDGGNLVLSGRFSGKRAGDRPYCEIWDPGTGAVEKIEPGRLEQRYSGYLILVHPEFEDSWRKQSTMAVASGSWFWGTLRKHWWGFSQVVLATVMINLFALTSPLFIMTVYDRVIPNNAVETLWVLAIGAATVFGFDFLIRYLRAYFIDHSGRNIDVILATRIFDQILNIKLQNRPNMAGSFANTVKEYESLREFFTSATLAIFVDLPFAFLFILVIWLVGGPMAFVPLVMGTLLLAVTLLLQFPLNKATKRNFGDLSAKHGVLVETITGLETLKAVGGDTPMRERWEGYVGSTAKTALQARLISTFGVSLTTVGVQLVTVLVVVIGALQVAEGAITQGAVVASVLLSGRAMAPLSQLSALLTRLHQSLEAYHGLSGVMKMPVERPAHAPYLHRSQLTGGIIFEKVDFSYPGTEQPILKQVSFSIAAGEKVAIVGRVGSGKSTILKQILGLYDPAGGTIMIDGSELHQIDPADLRRGIGYVPQEAMLFRGTVRDNITVARPHASDALVMRAAFLSGVDEYVSHHPLGFDMPIGEQGAGVSGGQRQAIAIARALLHQPPILLFDEPTSATDNRGEELFKQRMLPVLSESTLVLVTHKASLLTMADRIIVMDGGRIRADGPKEVVLKALADGLIRGDARGEG